MNASRTPLVILLLAGIFLFGGISGWLAGRSIQLPAPEPEPPTDRRGPGMTERHVLRLVGSLELTDDQRAVIGPKLRSHFEEIRQVRRESLQEVRAIMDRLGEAIRDELNEAQQAKFDAYQERVRQRIEEADAGPFSGHRPPDLRPRLRPEDRRPPPLPPEEE